MTTPKPTSISIIILTLLSAIALAWSSIAAPCIEIGFFWASVVTALSAALYAWTNSDRISQGAMLMVYCLLACSITLAVASIVDIANFTILGNRRDAETGLLLGGLVAFGAVASIAVRCSKRFPASLSWGTLWSFLVILGFSSLYYRNLAQEYAHIGNVAVLLVGVAAFMLLCRCKHNLSDSQYLSILCIIMTFISLATPDAKENLVVAILASLMLLLSGMLFFSVRKNAPSSVRIGALMLLSFGVSSVISDIFQKWLGMNEILVGIPSLIVGMLIICWIRFQKEILPRGLYWVSLFVFACFSTLSVIPEKYSDKTGFGILGALALFVLACIWYAPSIESATKPAWRYRFGLACSICIFVMAMAFTNVCCMLSMNMLIRNYSPVLYIAMLKNTPLWPGDAAFVRLVMQHGTLWAEEIGNDPPEHLSINQYLKAIRPSEDRFSIVFDNKDDRNDAMGLDTDGIGIKCFAAKGSLTLTKVNSASSAGKLGLARGDRIQTINGISVRGLKVDTDWNTLFGEGKMGTKISLNLLTRNGKSRNVSMPVTVNPQDPPKSSIITTQNGNNVGYLYLENFNTTQFKDIRKHFETFKNAGVHDLVLDLRYNSGGMLDKAIMLASLVGGKTVSGKLFIRWETSQRYEDNVKEYIFESIPESMQTRRLVVLTTEDTCSASESVINGLRPYMPVYTVGSKTCGKPFGMETVEFGDKTVAPVSARVLNSRGEGHYINGIRADFKVEDDLSHQLGDPQEAMLKKALEVLSGDTASMGSLGSGSARL